MPQEHFLALVSQFFRNETFRPSNVQLLRTLVLCRVDLIWVPASGEFDIIHTPPFGTAISGPFAASLIAAVMDAMPLYPIGKLEIDGLRGLVLKLNPGEPICPEYQSLKDTGFVQERLFDYLFN